MTEQPSSLERARKLQAEAAMVGFDWPALHGMLDKLDEELAELRQALSASGSEAAAEEELGDILFVLVNLARRLGLVPETILQQACDKFERRFAHVRAALAQRGQRPGEAGLDVMEALWNEAKQIERQR
jgi:uncharacterized protein YabN with tetrapyrrole methylase and pyrophosphatase domain